MTQLSLARLTPGESLQVLRAIPQVALLPEPLVHELLTKADGNPFFLEELIHAVIERSLEHTPDIPETIQAGLTARIDRLPPPEKHLL